MVEGGRFEIYCARSRTRGSNPRLSATYLWAQIFGEVTEWLKVHDWNSCVGQLTGGSNPPLSAPTFKNPTDSPVGFFWFCPSSDGLRAVGSRGVHADLGAPSARGQRLERLQCGERGLSFCLRLMNQRI